MFDETVKINIDNMIEKINEQSDIINRQNEAIKGLIEFVSKMYERIRVIESNFGISND